MKSMPIYLMGDKRMKNTGLGCSENWFGGDCKLCISCDKVYKSTACKAYVSINKRWVHNVVRTYGEPYEVKISENTEISNMRAVCTSLADFLEVKNKNYGNSALEPVKIFSKTSAESQILNRIDDKLSRIKNSEELRKNDVVDLMGYLVLLCIKKGWMNFKDLID